MNKLLVLCLLTLSGCTNVNVPLNDLRTALERRERNHTRAETGYDPSQPPALANTEPERTPASSPVVRDDAAPPPPAGYRPDLPDQDGYFVGIALSGGGSRSANFSAACMFELQRLGLLAHADCLSSVSGGSLTAAFYCISDAAGWNPRDAQQKLTHEFANDVIVQAILPWNAIVLAFSDWDRSDLLANSLRSTLFTAKKTGKELTFADLRTDRPRLLINATDLQSGRPFVFCNASFDQLNSDLARYPLAHAVAASAAVPVVMHQVTLRDYSTSFKQYRHLIDGGINDNLGITTLVESYESSVRAAEQEGEPNPYPHGAVLIVLDARTRFDARLDDKGDIGLVESFATGTALTSNSLLNRVSTATLADIIVRYSPDAVTAATLRSQIAELNRDGYIELRDRRGAPVIVVHLALSRVDDLTDLPSQGFFQRLNNIATYFNISEAEAASLYKAAELLVHQKFEPQLRRLANKLDSSTASVSDR